MRTVVVSVCTLLGGCAPLFASGDDWQPAVCGDGVLGDGETCDDGNAVDGDGCNQECFIEPRIEATWTIEHHDGTVVDCPAGFDVAELRSGATTIAFPCSDRHGTMQLPVDYVGTPLVMPTLAILSTDRISTYSVAPAPHTYSANPAAKIDFKLYTDAAYFRVDWPGGCGTSGTPITVTATEKSSSLSFTWTEPCSATRATEVAPLGDYTLALSDATRTGSTDLILASPAEIVELSVSLH